MSVGFGAPRSRSSPHAVVRARVLNFSQIAYRIAATIGQRRLLAAEAIRTYGLSERQTCRPVGINRSGYRCLPKQTDDGELIARLQKLAKYTSDGITANVQAVTPTATVFKAVPCLLSNRFIILVFSVLAEHKEVSRAG